MISRIRIEAFGHTAAEVENWLTALASRVNFDFGLQSSFGEQVIQRNVGEPEGTRLAFNGRLILHPNVAEDAPQRHAIVGVTGDQNYRWTPERGTERV